MGRGSELNIDKGVSVLEAQMKQVLGSGPRRLATTFRHAAIEQAHDRSEFAAHRRERSLRQCAALRILEWGK
jgi:hypothetical protein